ncbi:MAG: hypothetical protein LC800_14875 [Acidobacteria bacterium]|nr:hypothetical protein [Acidobacteriota bacterium]
MSRKKLTLALMLLTLAGAAAASSFQTKEQESDAQEKPRKYKRQNMKADTPDYESQFPVADYHRQEPADEKELAKRRARGARYDNRNWVAGPEDSWSGTGARWFNHWDMRLAELPLAESDLVIVGKVTNARAYLSNDKHGVYSEFALRVERVLAGDAAEAAAGKVIEAEREGGRVRFSDDDIDLYLISGMGMPRPARRYVFFLKGVEGQPGYFSIVRGFEIHGRRIYPLDRRDTSSSPLDAYWDMEEGAFEKILQDKIKKEKQ